MYIICGNNTILSHIKMSIDNILQDLSLLDFFEEKNDETLLIDSNALTSLMEEYHLNHRQDSDNYRRYAVKAQRIGTIIKEDYSWLYDILIFGKGKISVCGLSVLQIIMGNGRATSINLYLHSCTNLEGNILIQGCIQLLSERSTFYSQHNNRMYFLSKHNLFVIRLSLEIYKDRGQILRNNGFIPERLGWDPIFGFFSTISGALSLIYEINPIGKCDFRKEHHYTFYEVKQEIILNWTTPVYHMYNFKGVVKYGIRVEEDLSMKSLFRSSCVRSLEQLQGITSCIYQPSPIIRLENIFNIIYKPNIIGIPNNRYIAFSNIRKIFNINNDIFRLLCWYWLQGEVGLAKERLLK